MSALMLKQCLHLQHAQNHLNSPLKEVFPIYVLSQKDPNHFHYHWKNYQ